MHIQWHHTACDSIYMASLVLQMHGCFVLVPCQKLIDIERWHYNLAQFYGPGYVVVKIRWDELSHMGLITLLLDIELQVLRMRNAD